MAKLFYLHRHEAEAKARAAQLNAAGREVHVHWSTVQPPQFKNNLPDIAVISLGRLPSHGRAVAEWLWEAKSRRGIPIIFKGGAPDKVAATRGEYPKAHFCAPDRVLAKLQNLDGKDRDGR